MFPALVYTRRPSFLPFLFSPLLAPSRFAHPHTPLVFTRATFSYHLILLVLCSSRHRPQCYTDFQIAGFAVDRQVRILRPDRRGRCVLRTCTILYKSLRPPPGHVRVPLPTRPPTRPPTPRPPPTRTPWAPTGRRTPGHTVPDTQSRTLILLSNSPPPRPRASGGVPTPGSKRRVHRDGKETRQVLVSIPSVVSPSSTPLVWDT